MVPLWASPLFLFHNYRRVLLLGMYLPILLPIPQHLPPYKISHVYLSLFTLCQRLPALLRHIKFLFSFKRFDITPNGQQVHVSFGPPATEKSSRHPCFKVESKEALRTLQTKIWTHFIGEESCGRPSEADQPGTDSGRCSLKRLNWGVMGII